MGKRQECAVEHLIETWPPTSRANPARNQNQQCHRVGHSRPLPGAERRLDDPDRPFTPGWLQHAIQRPFGRIASTPAVDPLPSLNISADERPAPTDKMKYIGFVLELILHDERADYGEVG